eukprot:3678031-Rhodomonas_salina.3
MPKHPYIAPPPFSPRLFSSCLHFPELTWQLPSSTISNVSRLHCPSRSASSARPSCSTIPYVSTALRVPGCIAA